MYISICVHDDNRTVSKLIEKWVNGNGEAIQDVIDAWHRFAKHLKFLDTALDMKSVKDKYACAFATVHDLKKLALLEICSSFYEKKFFFSK